MSQYIESRIDHLKKWKTFLYERFEPLSHFVMIGLFFTAHYLLAKSSSSVEINSIHLAWLIFGVTAFFLKLRFYDEIKDYETDVTFNPTRPLPRGLFSKSDMKKGIENCIILEVIFFASSGGASFISILFVIGYSLLMYKEFFIPKLIRPHLTTYAISHTIITVFISLAIFSALNGHFPWAQHKDFYLFSIMSWLLFNIFEFGRKIYQPSEERDGVATYSKVWGRAGAVLLVAVHAVFVAALMLSISSIDHSYMQKYQIVTLSLLGLASLTYLFTKKAIFGKLYRRFSEVYIVIIYTGLISNYLLQQYYWT